MRQLLLGLAILPLLGGSGWAATALNDAQMDRITGGDGCPFGFSCGTGTLVTTTFTCPTCSSGQAFIPTSPQTFFSDLVKFLGTAGYPPK
jgi:hypothetical protein